MVHKVQTAVGVFHFNSYQNAEGQWTALTCPVSGRKDWSGLHLGDKCQATSRTVWRQKAGKPWVRPLYLLLAVQLEPRAVPC